MMKPPHFIVNSIDCGIRNFAIWQGYYEEMPVNIFEPEPTTTQRLYPYYTTYWYLHDLGANLSDPDIIISLYRKMKSIHHILKDASMTLIEVQRVDTGYTRCVGGPVPTNSSTMIAISHATQMYFLTHDMPVTFVSPANKLKLYDGPPITIKTRAKSYYAQNKLIAPVHGQYIIARCHDGQKWLQHIARFNRDHDLYDCFLNALYWMKMRAKGKKAMRTSMVEVTFTDNHGNVLGTTNDRGKRRKAEIEDDDPKDTEFIPPPETPLKHYFSPASPMSLPPMPSEKEILLKAKDNNQH